MVSGIYAGDAVATLDARGVPGDLGAGARSWEPRSWHAGDAASPIAERHGAVRRGSVGSCRSPTGSRRCRRRWRARLASGCGRAARGRPAFGELAAGDRQFGRRVACVDWKLAVELDADHVVIAGHPSIAVRPDPRRSIRNSARCSATSRRRRLPSSHWAIRGAAIPHPLEGFGFLVPRSEGLRTLGVLWESSIFPARAPADHVLLRAMIGGAHDPDAVALDDDELLAIARGDLQRRAGHLSATRLHPRRSTLRRAFRSARSGILRAWHAVEAGARTMAWTASDRMGLSRRVDQQRSPTASPAQLATRLTTIPDASGTPTTGSNSPRILVRPARHRYIAHNTRP